MFYKLQYVVCIVCMKLRLTFVTDKNIGKLKQVTSGAFRTKIMLCTEKC